MIVSGQRRDNFSPKSYFGVEVAISIFVGSKRFYYLLFRASPSSLKSYFGHMICYEFTFLGHLFNVIRVI